LGKHISATRVPFALTPVRICSISAERRHGQAVELAERVIV
jgi:hypothetical protein